MHAWVIFPLQQHIGHLFRMYLPFNSVTDAALQFLPQPHGERLHIFCHSSAPFLPCVRHQYQPALVPELWSFFQKVHQRQLPSKNMAVIPHLTTQSVTNHQIIGRYSNSNYHKTINSSELPTHSCTLMEPVHILGLHNIHPGWSKYKWTALRLSVHIGFDHPCTSGWIWSGHLWLNLASSKWKQPGASLGWRDALFLTQRNQSVCFVSFIKNRICFSNKPHRQPILLNVYCFPVVLWSPEQQVYY